MDFRIRRLSNIRRYKQVTEVLTRHGISFVAGWFDWARYKLSGKEREPKNTAQIPVKVRLAIEELGVTFVKLGQILSMRPDLIPRDFINELEKLQDNVAPFPIEEVDRVLLDEGIIMDETFAYFEAEPIAAASIGQVHRARLISGEEVAVKVQRPGISNMVRDDMEILYDLARLAESRTSWGKLYHVRDIVKEFEESLTGELDFTREGRNADRFRSDYSSNPHVIIPRIFWPLTSQKVLVMEYRSGIKISDIDEMRAQNIDIKLVCDRLIGAMFDQVYYNGFFHADPHPGNIAVISGEQIIFYDFGQVGQIDHILKQNIMDLILSMVRSDVNGVMQNLLALGISDTGKVHREDFRKDIAKLQRKYYGVPMSDVHLGEALQELINLTAKHQVRLPPELALIVKMLLSMESIVSALDPDLAISEIAEPFARKIIKERYSVRRLRSSLQDTVTNYSYFAKNLPNRVLAILELMEEGDFGVDIEITNIREFLKLVDMFANRLSISVVTAALIIGSSLAMATKGTTSLLQAVPLPEIGFVLSFMLGLYLVYTIFRRTY